MTALGEVELEIRGLLAAIGACLAATAKFVLLEYILAAQEHTLTNTPRIQSDSNIFEEEDEEDITPIHTIGSINAGSDGSSTSKPPRQIRVAPASTAGINIGINKSSATSTSPSNKNPSSQVYASVASQDDYSTRANGASPSSSAAASIAPLSAHGPKLHPMLSLFYFTPVSALLIIPFQLWFESGAIANSAFVQAGMWEKTVGLIILGSLIAFALNTSELMMIQATSALTLCVFGVFKFLLVILASIILFSYKTTLINRLGISCAVLGVIIYNADKYEESKITARGYGGVNATAAGVGGVRGSAGMPICEGMKQLSMPMLMILFIVILLIVLIIIIIPMIICVTGEVDLSGIGGGSAPIGIVGRFRRNINGATDDSTHKSLHHVDDIGVDGNGDGSGSGSSVSSTDSVDALLPRASGAAKRTPAGLSSLAAGTSVKSHHHVSSAINASSSSSSAPNDSAATAGQESSADISQRLLQAFNALDRDAGLNDDDESLSSASKPTSSSHSNHDDFDLEGVGATHAVKTKNARK